MSLAGTDLLKKFSSDDFNHDKYVKETSQVCVGSLELQKHKANIQSLAEDTSQALKKNVYKNYMQFIETAREISHLEGEMYQLSHMLTEQRTLLANMVTSAAPGLPAALNSEPPKSNEEEQRASTIAAIMEKIEGCIGLLQSTDRVLIHESDLVELDPVENTALHRCHAFLFSDILLITTWISNRRGPAKYRFEASYELGALAVVNVRDLGNVKHAFKLLVFPDTRLFQCANHQSKIEWLDVLDEAKKQILNSEKIQRSDTLSSEQQSSPVRTDSIDSGTNPFGSCDDSEPIVDLLPEWVVDGPEDLEMTIAQRHFEDAYSLIKSLREYLEAAPSNHETIEIRSKLESRINSLIQVLLNDLSVGPDKSLQGGLRASRRSVRLLNQLGKSNEACELYLKLCSNILKSQIKRVKREGATAAYVRRLASVFFSNMAAITTEFQYRAFPNVTSCSSAFIVWSSMEVSNFTSHLIRQIFMPQTTLSTLAECIDFVRKQSDQLSELGLDLTYQLDGQLNTPITRALNDTRDKLIDAVKHRCSEDTWRPSHHGKVALHKLQQEFTAMGLPSLQPYVTGDGWLELTSNTLAFTKLYIPLLQDGVTLCGRDLKYSLDKVLYDVMDAQLRHVSASLKIDRLQPQKILIQKNAVFLMDQLLYLSTTYYEEKMGHASKKLEDLRKEYTPGLKGTTTVSSISGFI